MIPFELFLGAWLMAKGGWRTVWMAFGLIVLVEVVLRGFFGIDVGATIGSFIEQTGIMISSTIKGALS